MSYEIVIGLEAHIQLATDSKAFCSDAVVFGDAPNTHIGAISLAYPGTLPKLNKRQVDFAVRLGLALGCKISLENRFDRKNYFYADLPKGYQITQDRLPICIGGELPIWLEGEEKRVRIHHIHMEEDAGKSIHDLKEDASMIDLNRAGTPLLEVVTEPDLRSGEEVEAFMLAMRQLVRYLEISDGNMEQGSLRCDCNISVRKRGETRLGKRCEVKNMNSMKFARRAIEFESNRQIDLIESGGKVQQQTLNFDPTTGETSPLRSKEDAHDYRYFPEPDLPPIRLTAAKVTAAQKALPALPWQLREELMTTYQLSDYDTTILIAEKEMASFTKKLLATSPHHKASANLVINKILPHLRQERQTISSFALTIKQLAELIELVESNKISNTAAYQQLFPALLEQPTMSPEQLAKQLQLVQTQDEDFLQTIIADVLAASPDKVKAYQKGKKGLIGFFMGELMKQSKGKANPKVAKGLLEKALKK